jgi:hypothetical protein
MGIQIVWDNDEKTILRYIFDTHWTWDDFYKARSEAYNHIDTVQHKVGVIFDAPVNMSLPPNMITHSRSAINKTHDNTLIVVAVVANGYVRAMLSMVRKLSKKAAEKMELAPTLDEARTLAQQRLREVQ